MSEELKPCPFCGGQIEVLQFADTYPHEDLQGLWAIFPQNHNRNKCGLHSFGMAAYSTKQEAIDHWNTRTHQEGG